MGALGSRTLEQALRAVTSQLPGGGEDRPGQRAMAEAVASALAERRPLVVQAGTGTGKSLAYLVPAVLSGRRVVVATATKALQEQLAKRDLPLVASALGEDVSWAVVKGRSNYICRQRVTELEDRGFQAELGLDPSAGGARLADQLRHLVAWSKDAETGDRADLPFEPSPRAWGLVSVTPRECPGALRCPAGAHCFAEAARDQAASAQIIVVNTHLYGAHLASDGSVLPPHDAVVFDEAHQLLDDLTSALGVEVNPGRLHALAAALRGAGGAAAAEQALSSVADRLAVELEARLGRRVLGSAADGELGALLSRGAEAARQGLEALGRDLDDGHPDAARRRRARQLAGHVAEDLSRFAEPGDDEVAWVDGDQRLPVLRLSCIELAPRLAAQWAATTPVLTSATIPTRLGEEAGLGRGAFTSLDVGSPFDFRSHALLYVPRHLPDRRQAGAEPALHDELATLIAAAGGRTLALFTSFRALEAAVSALRPVLEVPLHVQGEMPKGRLLEAFAEEEASCLFATLSYWQGVDVPGPSLSVVVLDRLPFPRPDDPLLVARRERAGRAAFSVVDLPRAATMLAQGAGRLIRTAEDRGVVVVLDRRLATATYRHALLAALPPLRRTVDIEDVKAFLADALEADRSAGS